jgi:hypothetical protein
MVSRGVEILGEMLTTGLAGVIVGTANWRMRDI